MSTVLSVETDIQAKTLSMNDIRLPGPESRIVVFAGTVFKLKYKLRWEKLDSRATQAFMC